MRHCTSTSRRPLDPALAERAGTSGATGPTPREASPPRLPADPGDTSQTLSPAADWLRATTRVVQATLPGVDLLAAVGRASLAPTRALTQVATQSINTVTKHLYYSGVEEDRRDSKNLRNLLQQVVGAAGLPAEDVPTAMRVVLADHKELLEWMCAKRDVQQLFDDAAIPGQLDFNVPSWLRTVSSLLPEVKPLGRNPLVRGAIDLAGRPARNAVLRLIPDAAFTALANQINYEIDRVKFSEQPEFTALLDPEKGIDLSKVKERMRTIISDVLTKYPDTLPVADKRRVMMAVLELPADASLSDKLLAVLQKLPAGYQKMAQLAGDETKSPLLSEPLGKLKEEVDPMTPDQVDARIFEETGRLRSDLYPEFDPKPVGSGTIGQVHFAKYKRPDGKHEDVAVKVKRPNVEASVEAEFALIRKLVEHDSYAAAIVDDLKSSILEECDYRVEHRKTAEVGRVYRTKSIEPVKLVEGIEPTEGLLVMHRVQGHKIDKAEDQPVAGMTMVDKLLAKGDGLTKLLEVSFRNGIFGDGQIHCDPHKGNLRFRFLPGEKPNHRLAILDFGATDQLPFPVRLAFQTVGSGVVLHSPYLALKGLEFICSHGLTPEQRVSFEKKIPEVINGPGSYMDKIAEILLHTTEVGVKLPKSATQFNRMRLFIEQQIREVNEKLEQHDPDHKLRRFSIDRLYEISATRGLLEQGYHYGKLPAATAATLLGASAAFLMS